MYIVEIRVYIMMRINKTMCVSYIFLFQNGLLSYMEDNLLFHVHTDIVKVTTKDNYIIIVGFVSSNYNIVSNE